MNKDDIENHIRRFFKNKLDTWKIHEIPKPRPQVSMPFNKLSTTVKKHLESNPQDDPTSLLSMDLTEAQQRDVAEQILHAPPRPSTYSKLFLQQNDKFMNRANDTFSVRRIRSTTVTLKNDKTKERNKMPNDTLKRDYIPVPKINSIYTSKNGMIFRVIAVNSSNDIDVVDPSGVPHKIDFDFFQGSTSMGMGLLKRPTKKRRHKRRNTRKGG
jgi:hypothetical protein